MVGRRKHGFGISSLSYRRNLFYVVSIPILSLLDPPYGARQIRMCRVGQIRSVGRKPTSDVAFEFFFESR